MVIDCSRCPENDKQGCCGLMLFEKSFIERFKDKIEDGFIKVTEANGKLVYDYKDCRCPFLDRKTRLCKVYQDRPNVCRSYGYTENLQCPYFKASGNPRSEGSRKQIFKMIDRHLNAITKKRDFGIKNNIQENGRRSIS